MQVMAANGNRKLVAVECYPGAYQGDALLYLASPSSPPVGPLKLRVYEDPGNGHVKLTTATTILGALDFTRSTGTLTVLDKFRGLGDCGILSTYRLEGSRLVLTVAARAKNRLRRQTAVFAGALAEVAACSDCSIIPAGRLEVNGHERHRGNLQPSRRTGASALQPPVVNPARSRMLSASRELDRPGRGDHEEDECRRREPVVDGRENPREGPSETTTSEPDSKVDRAPSV